MLQNRLDASRLESFRWCPNTLYDMHGNDVDVCVLDMLHRAVSPTKIRLMLDSLLKHERLSVSRHRELLRLVMLRSGAIFDEDPVFPESTTQMVLTKNELPRNDPVALEKKLKGFVDKM